MILDGHDTATKLDTLGSGGARMVDITMLYAPRSGGVKRYLDAKRAWLARHRPQVSHTLIVPGPRAGLTGQGGFPSTQHLCRLAMVTAGLPVRQRGCAA